MMKKTIFGKFLAIAMIFAGFSLTSCDEKDNAIIDGKVYVKPEVQLVDGGAVIKATTISDINKMIAHIRKDVIEAGGESETFTIKINAPALTTALSENTIGLPTANGTDIIVEFTNPIATSDDAPLIIQSIGVADNAGPQTKNNDVEINFAAGTSDIDLGLNMPKSTVTLKGATIDELVALTAKNTLIIESGVTVNWLLNKYESKTVIMEGGEVLGALVDYGINIAADGAILENTFENEIPEGFNDFNWNEKQESFIRVNNVKVIGNEDRPAEINIQGYGEEPEDIAEVDVIIEDGVKTMVYGWYDAPYHAIVNITGEGDNAQIVTRGNIPEDGDWTGKIVAQNVYLQGINKLSNVTVDLSKCIYEHWVEEVGTVSEELETECSDGGIWLPQNSENCTFIAPYYSFRTNQDNNSASFKDCTFKYVDVELNNEDNLLRVNVEFPKQTKERTSFDLSFDNCNFDKVFKFNTWFNQEEDPLEVYDGYEALITLENVKMDGKAVTKSTEMIKWINNIEKPGEKPVLLTTTLFAIDGATYEPVHTEGPEGKWILIEVEAEE